MKLFRKRKAKKWVIICAILLAIIVIWVWIDSGLRPNIAAVGEAQLRNTAIRIMNDAATESLKEENFQNLLTVEKDEQGQITMLSADSVALNQFARTAAAKAQEGMVNLSASYLRIPLGNILGSKLFAGQGPKIKIKVEPVGTVTTGFSTEFETAGINQTRYKIYVVMTAAMRMVVGSASYMVEESVTVLICDAIVVGNVPQTYADIPDGDSFLNLVP